MRHARVLTKHVKGNQIYLLPGCSSHLICKSAATRLVGFSKHAWSAVWTCVKKGIAVPEHGLKGAPSNRLMDSHQETLAHFFETLHDLSTPRATRVVRVVAEHGDHVRLRDDNKELTELFSYMTKRGLYKRLMLEHGWIYTSDAVGIIGKKPSPGMEQTPWQGVPSFRTYLVYWKKHHPHLVITNPAADIYGDCYIFANQSALR